MSAMAPKGSKRKAACTKNSGLSSVIAARERRDAAAAAAAEPEAAALVATAAATTGARLSCVPPLLPSPLLLPSPPLLPLASAAARACRRDRCRLRRFPRALCPPLVRSLEVLLAAMLAARCSVIRTMRQRTSLAEATGRALQPVTRHARSPSRRSARPPLVRSRSLACRSLACGTRVVITLGLCTTDLPISSARLTSVIYT